MTDSERLDLLERIINTQGGIVLHDGCFEPKTYAGVSLRSGYLTLTLREAIDAMAPKPDIEEKT